MVGIMAHFLKTVSATFAAGVICGAGALIALAPSSPAPEVQQADKAQPETKMPVAVVNPASVPCKGQVWPNIDRRCMRWTAEAWTPPGQHAGTGGAPPAGTKAGTGSTQHQPASSAAPRPAGDARTAQATSQPATTAKS